MADALARRLVLWSTPLAEDLFHGAEAAARSARISLQSRPIAAQGELDGALAAAPRERAQGLVVLSSPLIFPCRCVARADEVIEKWTDVSSSVALP
jgi:hypothetical protein